MVNTNNYINILAIDTEGKFTQTANTITVSSVYVPDNCRDNYHAKQLVRLTIEDKEEDKEVVVNAYDLITAAENVLHAADGGSFRRPAVRI